jgi:hypothetical protein
MGIKSKGRGACKKIKYTPDENRRSNNITDITWRGIARVALTAYMANEGYYDPRATRFMIPSSAAA